MSKLTKEEQVRRSLQLFLEANKRIEKRLLEKGKERLANFRTRVAGLIQQIVETTDIDRKIELIKELYRLDREAYDELEKIFARLRQESPLFAGMKDVSQGGGMEALASLATLEERVVQVFVQAGATFIGEGGVAVAGNNSGSIITGNHNVVNGSSGSADPRAAASPTSIIEQKATFPIIESDYHVVAGVPFWFAVSLTGAAQSDGRGSPTTQTPAGTIDIRLGEEVKILVVRLHALDFKMLSPVNHPITYIVATGDSNQARFKLVAADRGINRYFSRLRATIEDEYHKPITEVVHVLEVLQDGGLKPTEVVDFPRPAAIS